MEVEIKCFVEEETRKPDCSFTISKLAHHVNKEYCELTKTKQAEDVFIRSETILRLDLKSCGYKNCKNTKRPYFEGHERQDVINVRKEVVDYFIDLEEHYYRFNEDNKWSLPTEKPCILIFHDESTFRFGEQFHSRWLKEGNEPFLKKG